MLLNIQLVSFLLLLSTRNKHSLIRPINLECDSHLFSDVISEILLIFQFLVLIVSVFLINEMVEDLAGIGHIERFTIFELYFNFFRKPLWQKHPNPIGV